MWKNLFRRLLGKPPMMTHTPPPATKGRVARPAVSTSTRTVQLHVSLFNWHKWGSGKAVRPPQAPGRSLLDLRALDWAFGKRPAAPQPTLPAARVAAARRRTAARTQVPRASAQATGTSRPVTKTEERGVRKRAAEREAKAAKQAATQPATGDADQGNVVEGTLIESSKVVPVKKHTRAGRTVQAHTRSAPED